MNSTESGKKGKQLINALTRGLIILETILEKDSIGITEMSKILEVNKSSAYRLISTLEERGYVMQEPSTSKYRLGPKLIIFGDKALKNLKIREVARPYLKKLTEATSETSHLCILSQNQALFIDQELSSERIGVNTYIGMSEPIYCSAVGKALVSFLDEDRRKEIISLLSFEPFTPKTITDPVVLEHELGKTRERGYAFDDEELSVGLRCIAAPIFNHNDKPIASIGISGPVTRIQLDKLAKYIDAVMAAAKGISERIGFNGRIPL